MSESRLPRWRLSPAVVLLAALAYLPALTAAPGRMPADSKLYLYLDPQRLVSDAPYAFDGRQFAGWVPHQHIAYLWPSGPWFSVFDWLGVPDWIAHRLWLGTLFFLAGLGVRWTARLLGLSAAGALVAALVYQLSPYVLPYSSRTSVMLLPWAGLGWIVGLTMLAALRSYWRHAALIALVVLTVGAVNATALLLIVPGPALWLLHAVWSGQISWHRAGAVIGRVGVLCAAVSLWWIAALVIQGRYGADVLSFSETLEAVSFTSTSTEVLRGLGYWLFYLRDAGGATTSASLDHLVSGRSVAIGLVLVVVSMAGLVVTRWAHRRFAVLLVACGVVLAVGVHPIDDRSPLMALLVDDTRSGLALALRSSTRAVPVSLLGLALGAGALATAIGASGPRRWESRRPRELAAATAIALLAVVNLPALRTGGLVDPALERDQSPPAAWLDASAHLDARPPGYRVLQLPGAEFGAFRWGYTVDQPLPGLTERPLVTRDLLPLGSGPAMDLLYAFDDRFQNGVAEGAAIAPVARLLAADVVWLANDLAFERFRIARPDIVADLVRSAPQMGPVLGFGEPTVNVPRTPMVDEDALLLGGDPGPLPPVELVEVTEPVPIVRAKDRVVVLAGNGDGIVDAAAAGLIDGTELVQYAGAFDADDLTAVLDDADLVIVTDTNRVRARHWRSSQDVTGFTESGDGEPPLLVPDTGDQRFEIFDGERPGSTTTAHQVGPVRVTASGYGQPFAHRPEDRAVNAIDGDPDTAWIVADRFEATGERIRLDIDRDPDSGQVVDHVTVLQPVAPSGARRIAAVEVTASDGATRTVDLDETSLSTPGQRIDLPTPLATPAWIEIEIVETDAETEGPDAWGGVGFAEIDLGLSPTMEVVRLPTDALSAIQSDTPVAVVLTRERVDPTDRWRSDPESNLVRELELPVARAFDPEITVRLDQRAADALLADLLGIDGAAATARLTGSAISSGWSAIDGREETAWTTPFSVGGPDSTGPVGAELVVEGARPGPIGEVQLRQPDDDLHSRITAIAVTGSHGTRVEREVPAPDADGRSVIDLADVVGPDLTIEIIGVEQRVTIDRRFGDPAVLPVAIVDISGEALPLLALPGEVDTGCRDDLVWFDGSPLAIRIVAGYDEFVGGASMTAQPCDDGPVDLAAGTRRISTAPGAETGLQVDRIVLSSGRTAGEAPSEPVEVPTADVVEQGRTTRTIEVGGCTDGCWLVLGEGYNTAWQASVGGRALPEPVLVDGGFNGWWIEPVADGTTVDVTFGPQPVLTVALLLSAFATVGCIVVVAVDRRRRPAVEPLRPTTPTLSGGDPPTSRSRAVVIVAVWAVVAAVVVQPIWALPALVIGLGIVLTRTPRIAGWIGLGASVVGSGVIVWRVVQDRPVPDAGWVLTFDDLHRPGLFVVTALVVSAVGRDSDPGPHVDQGDGGADHDDRLERGPEPVRTVEER